MIDPGLNCSGSAASTRWCVASPPTAPLEHHVHDELLASGARPRRAIAHGPDALTPSEPAHPDLMAKGSTSRNIAETLFLTLSPVEWHRRNIYRKLGVGSRDELREALGAVGAG